MGGNFTIGAGSPKNFVRSRLFTSVSVLAVTLAGILPATVQAQQSQASRSSNILEEVVVTAQRREQSVQDVPLTVNAFTAKDLGDLSMDNARDLQSLTPTLVYQSTSSNFSAPSIYLRGLGNESFHANAGSPVGVYFDGSYVGSNTAYGFQLMDLERVEVLKGPQGTLYGRNTIAGLLNYIPAKPVLDDELSGELSVTYGRFNKLNFDGSVNVPLNDWAALRVAGKSDHNDGQYSNVSPTLVEEDYGGYDVNSVRASLLMEPNERLTMLATAHFGDLDAAPGIVKPTHLLDPASTPVGFPTGLAIVPCTVHPGLGSPCADVTGFIPNGDFDTMENEFAGFEETESWGLRFKLDYDFENFTVTSITTYDETSRRVHNDTDGVPSALLYASLSSEYEAFSQELRVTSTSSGPWKWIAGFYFYTDDVDQWEGVSVPFIDSLFGGGGHAGRDLLQDTTTWAFFGDVTYAFNDRFEVAAGLRVTNDDREGVQNRFFIDSALIPSTPTLFISREIGLANNVGVAFPDTELDNDWTEISGRISLTYHWSDDVMTYVTGARGFKGGEINGAPSNATDVSLSDPEFLNTVEIGLKGDFWQDRVRANVAGFYYDFEDQQVFVEEPLPSGFNRQIISNAGSSEIYGVEASATILPFDHLRLNLTAAYMEAEFQDFVADPLDSDGNGDIQDNSGNRLANSPELFFTTVARYDIPLQNGSVVTLQGDANLQDSRFFTATENQFLAQEAYWLVGARITFLSPDENWDVSFFGRNLTDEEYYVGGFDFTGLAGSQYPLTVGDRLTWGVTGSYRF